MNQSTPTEAVVVPAEGALDDVARTRLLHALVGSWAADVELSSAALHLMCLQIRQEHASAETAVFEWSDQGDWLHLVDVLDASGGSLDWYDHDCLAANFEGQAAGFWRPYMGAPAVWKYRLATDRFYLPISEALRAFGSEDD